MLQYNKQSARSQIFTPNFAPQSIRYIKFLPIFAILTQQLAKNKNRGNTKPNTNSPKDTHSCHSINIHTYSYPMTKPAQPLNPKRIQQAINQQSWLILTVICIGLSIDLWQKNPILTTTKNLAAGAILAWVGQILFAKISLNKQGYHQRKQIVHRLYHAQVLKWVTTIVGFTIIFLYLKPLQPLSVFVGYFILQLSYIVITYRQRW
jgi:ATP synthase protein I